MGETLRKKRLKQMFLKQQNGTEVMSIILLLTSASKLMYEYVIRGSFKS